MEMESSSLNSLPLFLCCSSCYTSTLISSKRKIMLLLHIFKLKEYIYRQQFSKHTHRLLRRLLSMIIPGQVILQAIQQVPFEAIVETRWGAWRLLKQCCRHFLLIWRQFPSANVNVNVKCAIIHKSLRNRIWKAGKFYFYYLFSICPTLCMMTTLFKAW